MEVDQITTLSNTQDKLKKLIRDASFSRVKTHSNIDNFEIQTPDRLKEMQVFNNWMSMILVSGNTSRITFKIHFNLNSARELAANMLNKPIESIQKSECFDYMKELCNLTAGYIKQQYENNKFDTGISLPLVTRGFNEIFFKTSNSKMITTDYWELSTTSINLLCSSEIVIYKLDALKKIEVLDPDEDQDDEDIFL